MILPFACNRDQHSFSHAAGLDGVLQTVNTNLQFIVGEQKVYSNGIVVCPFAGNEHNNLAFVSLCLQNRYNESDGD